MFSSCGTSYLADTSDRYDVGQGLSIEGTIVDAVGFEIGGYGNYGQVQYKNGKWSFGQETYIGGSLSFFWHSVGATSSEYKEKGITVEDKSWSGINVPGNSVSLFSAKAYLLFFGVSIDVGFNVIEFCYDL